jgi:hypothetical protein
MIDGDTLKAGDAIVYIDNILITYPDNRRTGYLYASKKNKSVLPSLLTLNKTYIILKTNIVSSSSIGVTIKADDDVIREFNIYNGEGLCRFKRLEDIREEKFRELGI